MQPTINASIVNNEDEYHCDYVYYSSPTNLSNDDIIILQNNGYVTEKADDENFIKRIVACPGQTITFYVIDDLPTITTYGCVVKNSKGETLQIDESFLDGEPMHLAKPLDSSTLFAKNNFPFYDTFYDALYYHHSFTYTLAENEYFVMGDNREKSTDSRFFGPVKKQDIIGEVQLQVKYGSTLLEAIFEKIKSLF